MQSGHGAGAEGTDAADLWVRDPRTGEYRMRLPGEPVPRPAAAAARPPAPAPAGPGRGRTRRRARRQGGPWVVGAACFLLAVGGIGGYLVLHRSAPGSSAASLPQPGADGTPTAHCTASAAGPVPEPAVSGAFLQGSRATAVNVRVTVLNGTGTIGQAETVLTWLQGAKEGFLRSSNGGPASATAATSLVYAPNHVDQARTLAAVMGLPATALHGDGKTSGATGRMVLTLGQDFHGIGKPFAAPSPAASATADAGATTGCGSQ